MNFRSFIAAAVLVFGVSAVAVADSSRGVVPPSMEGYHVVNPIRDRNIYLLAPDAKSAYRVELFSDFTYEASEISPTNVPNTLPPKDWKVGGGRPVLRTDTDYASVIKKFRDADGWDAAYPQSVRDSLAIGFPDSWMQDELRRGEYGLCMVSGNETNLNRKKPFGVVIGESDVHDNTTVDIDWLVLRNPKKGQSRLADVSDVQEFPAIARSLTFSSREDLDAKLRLTFRVVLTHELRRERDPDAYSVCGNPVLPSEAVAYRPTKVELPTIPPVTVTDSLPPFQWDLPKPVPPHKWHLSVLSRYGQGRTHVDNIPIFTYYNYGDLGMRLMWGKTVEVGGDIWALGIRDFEVDGNGVGRAPDRVQRFNVFTLTPRVNWFVTKWAYVGAEYGMSWDPVPFAENDSHQFTLYAATYPKRFRGSVEYTNVWIDDFRTDEGVRWKSDMGLFRARAGWMLLPQKSKHSNSLELGAQAWWMNYRDPYWWVHTTPDPIGAYGKLVLPLDDIGWESGVLSVDVGYLRGWIEAQHRETNVRIQGGVNHHWQAVAELRLFRWDF